MITGLVLFVQSDLRPTFTLQETDSLVMRHAIRHACGQSNAIQNLQNVQNLPFNHLLQIHGRALEKETQHIVSQVPTIVVFIFEKNVRAENTSL